IGFFVNTLVMHTQINGQETFSQLLRQVRQTALGGYSHQDIPFEYLVEQLNPSRSPSYSPLFQVMLVLQNTPQETLELSGLKMSFPEPEYTAAKFDLTLNIAEQGDGFVCNWEYNTDLFRPDTITRMTGHFQVLLEGILYPVSGSTLKPEQSVYQLPLLTEAEKQQLLEWNQSPVSGLTISKTVVDLFREQVEKTPDNIAVVFEDKQLSYRELNTKANQLAHYLMTLGVGSEILVGICVERSMKMVIGILGILKSGGAYVPLDPDFPFARLQFMIEDSGVKVLLTQSHLSERLSASTANVVGLDGDREPILAGSGENPVRQSGPGNLLYVIYTSGSTGKPKGVLGIDNGMVNRLNWIWHTYPFETNEVCCARSSINFVDHIAELFSPLLKGVSLVLLSRESMRDVVGIINGLSRFKIRRLVIIPSLLGMILDQGDQELQELRSVKYWFCSGETLPVDLVKLFYKRLPDMCLVNIYGSSEVSADATAYRIEHQDIRSIYNVPIGKPISNIHVYVLDKYLNIVSVGVPGELHVGGICLSRGYLNRPELTAKKFVSAPALLNQPTLYLTGDLVRRLPDGNLEYLGRIDHQVKLRGFRI
ncbi:MAG: amino acid adenylation domain-containing protein, partial [bacterium]|nr:amino acid adenylation domain-containing protein [bacterium]